MHRCLQLAKNGAGFTKPNPLVGAVIVHNDKIIGEGFHRHFGEAHAEVNAVNSVKDKSLLAQSAMYVSLEPCAHYGKTPPCTELIVSYGIPRVIIATTDPNPKIAGKGIEILKNNGVSVTIGLLEHEARELNKIFFVNQMYKRPFVMLKWAQSADGFMDLNRTIHDAKQPVQISNIITQSIVHKFRSELQGIIVGTNTALLDNPQLTSRKWFGYNPTRIVIDRENKIPPHSAIFNNAAPTIVFTAMDPKDRTGKKLAKFIEIDFSKDVILQVLNHLYNEKVYSVLIEGGAALLQSFIEKNLWDEAFVETSAKKFISGVKAPDIQGQKISAKNYLDSVQFHLKSEITRNFL